MVAISPVRGPTIQAEPTFEPHFVFPGSRPFNLPPTNDFTADPPNAQQERESTPTGVLLINDLEETFMEVQIQISF